MKRKIGLLATARKKLNHPATAIELYISPLFLKAVHYAEQNYDTFYFYSAKEGFLTQDQWIEPYNVSIKNFSSKEKQEWAHGVVKSLLTHEKPEECIIYLHGGWVYREHLQPELTQAGYQFEIPLEGYSIGNQLKWYDDQNQ